MNAPTISVILPAWNEAARIEQTIATVARYVAANPNVEHIVIADDGSTDDTRTVIAAAAAREGLAVDVLAFPHRGKALTIRAAMLEMACRVDSDYLMMLDADDELKIDQLDHIAWSSDRRRTIYIGKRVGAIGASESTRPTVVRRAMSLAMRTASSVLLGLEFPDTQCGFKLFPRAVVPALFEQQRSTGWTFDAELLYIAGRVSRLPIVEVPVVWTPRGVSRVRPLAAIASGFAMFGTAWNRARRLYRPVVADTSRVRQVAIVKS